MDKEHTHHFPRELGMPEKLMLFTPGPVMTSEKLKSTPAHSDIPHRRGAFEEPGANPDKSAQAVQGWR